MNVERAMSVLANVVDLADRYVSQQGDADEWRHGPLLLDSVIPRLNDVFRARLIQIESSHDLGASEESPKDLIHYTSIDTLISIIRAWDQSKNSFLRMYDSFHLNDPEEGQYFTRSVSLTKEFRWHIEEKSSHAYIASFIVPKQNERQELGDEDNLQYWLAYGQRGTGCSIRFPVRHNRFRQVLYGKDKVIRALEILDLPSICNCLQPLTDSGVESFRDTARRMLSESVWENLERIRYLYKDEAYEYEQECRLVISELDVPEGEIRFDPVEQPASSHRFRHYYQHNDLRIGRLLATDSVITLGPLVPRPENMEYYIKSLLEERNLKGPKIVTSKIPYR